MILSSTGGATSPAAGNYSYASGDTITISETPSNGYQWSHWTINGSNGGNANPLTFIITGNTTVQPVFSVINTPPPPPPPGSSFTLTVLVTNKTQGVLGALVSVSGGYLGSTDATGTVAFSLPGGFYTVGVVYDGVSQSKTVNLTADHQLTFDISSNSTSSPSGLQWLIGVAPWWFWILVTSIGVVAVAAIVVKVKGKKP
jgi:hypothetical protein